MRDAPEGRVRATLKAAWQQLLLLLLLLPLLLASSTFYPPPSLSLSPQQRHWHERQATRWSGQARTKLIGSTNIKHNRSPEGTSLSTKKASIVSSWSAWHMDSASAAAVACHIWGQAATQTTSHCTHTHTHRHTHDKEISKIHLSMLLNSDTEHHSIDASQHTTPHTGERENTIKRGESERA